MPERFEIYIVYKRRYINTLPFLFLFLSGEKYLAKYNALPSQNHNGYSAMHIHKMLKMNENMTLDLEQ